MGREHNHAPICSRSTPLCRLMELYAEGYMLNEEDGHELVRQLFQRVNGFKEEEIKRYNLNSRKRQSNLRCYHNIEPTVPPTDWKEYLEKQEKLREKREEMKKRKLDDKECEAAKKKQRMSESTNGKPNGEMSGERQTTNGERGATNDERQTANGERGAANGERRTANGWRWVAEEGRWEWASNDEDETSNVDGGRMNDKETRNKMNDENNENVQDGVKWESISLDDLDKVLASLDKNVYVSQEDWDKSVRDWEKMINGAAKCLPKKDQKKKTNEQKGKEGNNDDGDIIVID